MSKLKQLSAVTLQEQLYLELLESIKKGKYKPGERIPAEMQLSQMYEVSRVTVRKALDQLVKDNILIKKHGKGTFVRIPAHVENVFSGGSFTDTCLRMNAVPSTKIISRCIQHVDSEIADLLSNTDNQAITITRLRSVNDTPCIVEIDYFQTSFAFLLDEELENSSILQKISERLGLIPSKFEDHFQIKRATKEFSKLLLLPTATPILEVTQTVLTENEEVIYINKQYINSEKYVYAVRSSK